ncbi:MAG: hypothetical protein ABIV13_01950 [Fimbriimonadales bacterium]
MWRKPVEIPRIRALREAMFKELEGSTIHDKSITLRLVVHAERRHGDLDNFLTGIMDALQTPHSRVGLDASDDAGSVAAMDWAAIENDALVDCIDARRDAIPTGEASYTLRLEF